MCAVDAATETEKRDGSIKARRRRESAPHLVVTVVMPLHEDPCVERCLRVVFVLDCTRSMRVQLESIPIAISGLFQACSSRRAPKAGVLCFRDYEDDWVTRWSGWHRSWNIDLETFLSDHALASGGGDYPEASKTALYELLEHVREDDDNDAGCGCFAVILADSPPHTDTNGSDPTNLQRERAALGGRGVEDGFDWLRLCEALRRLRIVGFPVIPTSSTAHTRVFWTWLAAATGGTCLCVEDMCSEAYVDTFLALTNEFLFASCKTAAAEREGTEVQEGGRGEDPLSEVVRMSSVQSSDGCRLPDDEGELVATVQTMLGPWISSSKATSVSRNTQQTVQYDADRYPDF